MHVPTPELLDDGFPEEHANYDLVNLALASHFSIASMYGCYTRQADVAPLLRALQEDESRHTLQLSLTGCLNFRDAELRSLLEHLPAELQILRLDLCFTGITAWTQDFQVAPVSLRHLQLRITGAATHLSGVNSLLHPSLQHLELWLANLPSLLQMELNALDQLRQVQELVMLVDGCPKLPPTSKQALRPISMLISVLAIFCNPGFRGCVATCCRCSQPPPPPPQLEVQRCPARATREQGLTCLASRRGRLEVGLEVFRRLAASAASAASCLEAQETATWSSGRSRLPAWIAWALWAARAACAAWAAAPVFGVLRRSSCVRGAMDLDSALRHGVCSWEQRELDPKRIPFWFRLGALAESSIGASECGPGVGFGRVATSYVQRLALHRSF